MRIYFNGLDLIAITIITIFGLFCLIVFLIIYIKTKFSENKTKKEIKNFHNKRQAFYLDNNKVINIPIGKEHKEYFKEINHLEYLKYKVRGYRLNDHILLYIGENFDIPYKSQLQLSIGDLINQFDNKEEIKWIGLGCKIGKEGEEWEPKKVINLIYKNNNL